MTSPELHRTLYKLSHLEQPEGYTPPDTSGDVRWPAYELGTLLRNAEKGYDGPYELLEDMATLVATKNYSYEEAACRINIYLYKHGVLKAEEVK